MKDSIRVAAVQMDVLAAQPEANLARMCNFIDTITKQGPVDLIIFPELANSGYVSSAYRDLGKAYAKLAEEVTGPFIETLAGQARNHGLFIVTGMLEAHPLIPATLFNSAVLIGPAGRVIGVHHKMHIPGQEKHFFYPGNTAEVFRTEIGNLAMIICADSIFPELSRVLSLKGAEVICGIFNLPKSNRADGPTDRLYHLVACRAWENVNYFIACARVGRGNETAFAGQTCIAAPDGELIARSQSEEEEEILRGTLYDDVLRQQRAILPFFRDRRPENYGLLAEPL